MSKLFIIIGIFLLFVCSCNTSKQIQAFDLIAEKIFVEKFDTLNTNENKYNEDNVIFKPGTVFKYEVSVSKNNKPIFVDSFQKDWTYSYKKDSNSISLNFQTEVQSGNPLAKYLPNYNQTSIKYIYSDAYNATTGVIENVKNLWLHPPRASIFSLLELSGFPYVKYPIQLNDEYEWNLLIGDHYSHPDFVNWKGNINTIYKYKVVSKTKLKTKFGTLKCFVIESTSENKLGIGKTTLYYHRKYGFVKTEFTSIDGTKFDIILVEKSNKNE